MPFGDFNHDGHVDGRDYMLFKIATGGSDSGHEPSGESGGGCGCLTVIVVLLILFGIVKLIVG